eukprot:2121497-Prymnesium_polylepis.2
MGVRPRDNPLFGVAHRLRYDSILYRLRYDSIRRVSLGYAKSAHSDQLESTYVVPAACGGQMADRGAR